MRCIFFGSAGASPSRFAARVERVAGIWRMLCILILIAAFEVGQQSIVNAAGPVADPLTADELLVKAAAKSSTACKRYRARNWLRQRIVRKSDLERYGIRLNDDWRQAPTEKPIVILVHGFNSTPEQNAAMMVPIREADFPCGDFAYPNDHTILQSAQLLSGELRQLSVEHPERRVVLVCHSMGSLVARACIEDRLYDPGNVDRLIMIAPPTHGSQIAHFAVGTDLWEHWLARRKGGPWRRTRDSIIDGLGEAADELCPDSEFLQELNARPRNSRVRYSILLGTGAHLDDAQLAWIRECVCDSLAKVPGADSRAERLKDILNDIDELVEGRGDGIVAVKRGRLEGVDDTLILPFGHLAVTGEPHSDVVRDVQKAVLQRLR
jgi:pimeloyl-ACP methyl ester carboxylesterase